MIPVIKSYKKALIIILFLVSNAALKGQDLDQTTSGEFWIGAQFITPSGDFRNKIERNLGYGGSIGGLWNPSNRINFFQVGAEIGLLYMGKDKKVLDGLDIKTTNSVFLMHIIARFRIQTTSNLKPYIDIIGGGKLFSTTTKFNNDIIDTISDLENKEILGEQTNGAWSYGTGIGLTKVNEDNIGFDIKILYMRGTQTKYIAPENFQQDSNGDFFYEDQNINRTDMISLSFSFIGLLK